MMPMDENFTRFLHFYDIDTSKTDIIADAYGLECILDSLMTDFDCIIEQPDDKLISKLLLDIEKAVNKY